MISSTNALRKILDEVQCLALETLHITDAIGRVTAEDVYSPIEMPPFNQSAMDGYAIGDATSVEFKVVGEHKAGDAPKYLPKLNEAVQIFTGAVVPDNTVSVIKQEDVIRTGDYIKVTNNPIEKGINIRLAGEQIQQGQIAVRKGTVLSSGSIGFLATLGIMTIRVTKLPRISIITTGNELVSPGTELNRGQIYESNSFMLQAAVQQEGIRSQVTRVTDDLELTYETLSLAIQNSDIVLITGGISVGKYDFVYSALSRLKIKDIVHKVSQKPGKPLYAGITNNKLIFGLPGNPAAALMCYYMYVLPAIRKVQGNEFPELLKLTTKLSTDYFKKGTLRNHLKGRLQDDKVEILPKQSSAMLGDFNDSNCIVILPGEEKLWKANELVEVLMLPI